MTPALVGSGNARIGLPAAIDILASGGSALDAVEAAVRLVEDNPDDHTVGYGGYPNIEGTVELDASIMDGSRRDVGAVGSLCGYREAITVARAVMERTPHAMIVGDGAARLAAEIGLEQADLLTDEAERTWRDGLDGVEQDGLAAEMLAHVVELVSDPGRVGGTVNVLGRDGQGNIAAAVSTSGWAWKHPGRLGDSPIISAGNYADSRYGAVACTGWGELTIRTGSARYAVALLETGRSLDDACEAALRDAMSVVVHHEKPAALAMVALGADGAVAGYSTRPGRYVWWQEGMATFDESDRRVVV